MNKLIRNSLLIMLVSILVGCAVSADRIRRTGSKEMQLISATRPLVYSCILQQTKVSTSSPGWFEGYEVVENKNSIQLKSGDITVRVYDLEDWVGGTMVTIYVDATGIYMKEAKLIIDFCRKQLESQKLHTNP